MSKSLGNFITVEDLRGRAPGEVIRFAMLMTQYRQPFDWSETLATEAETVLRKWRRLTEAVAPAAEPPAAVVEALRDDLNTPKAIAALHALAGAGDGAALLAGARLLGLLTPELGAWAEEKTTDDATAARIEGLIAARKAARKAKDFARSDAIRDGLSAAGVAVKDTPAGAEWSLEPGFDPAKLAELET